MATQDLASLSLPLTNQHIANGSASGKPTEPQSLLGHSKLSPMASQQIRTTNADDQKLRDRVKEALRDLHNNEIDFEKLSREGFDASILRTLYLEMGITVPLQLPLKDPNSLVDVRNVTQTQEPLPVEASREENHSKDDAATIISTSNTPNHTVGLSIEANSVQPISTSQNIPDENNIEKVILSDDHQDVKIISNPGPPRTSNVGTTTVPRKAVSGNKALERKDYIAKMLAAKSSKNIGIAKVPKVSEPVAVLAESKSPEVVDNTNVIGVVRTSVSPPVSGPSEKEIDAENKRKAQTELARKKMEALKTHSSVRRSEQPVHTQALPPLPSPPVIASESPPMYPTLNDNQPSPSSLPPTPLQLESDQKTILQSNPPPSYIPSSSFFSSLGRRPLFGIPGLFTSTLGFPPPPPPAPPSLSTQNELPVSPVVDPMKPAISQAPSTSSIPLSTETAQTSVPAVASPNESIIVNVPRAPLLSPDPAVNLKPIVSTSEQSRKRPTAADFIDSPSTRTKRRLGSSQHPDVFIELSEDEGDTDTDKMDVDGAPENTVTQKEPLNVVESAKAKAIRDLPPLSDFPSRIKPQTTSSTSTPPMVQTPGKAKEQETLKLKEEQILVMQRKIAEMEQRRKARQITSRMHSPGTSGLAQVESNVNSDQQSSSSQNGFQAGVDNKESLESTDQQLEAPQNPSTLPDGNKLRSLEAEGSTIVPDLSITNAIQRAISELSGEDSSKVNIPIQYPRTRENQPDLQSSEAPSILDGSDVASIPQAVSLVEMQHRRERRADLEVALLELDAQRVKTATKLKDLKLEIQELETEIQRGSDGRRSILEELDTLRNAEAQITTNGDHAPSSISQPKEVGDYQTSPSK